MHLVSLGWVWVIFMISLTAHSVVAGIAIFIALGLCPVLLLVYAAGRHRRRRNDASVLESEMHGGNNRDANGDQG